MRRWMACRSVMAGRDKVADRSRRSQTWQLTHASAPAAARDDHEVPAEEPGQWRAVERGQASRHRLVRARRVDTCPADARLVTTQRPQRAPIEPRAMGRL